MLLWERTDGSKIETCASNTTGFGGQARCCSYRQGVAGQLLKACEAVGAAAGFWTFYIQADTEQHNHSTFLPFDTKEYNAAVNAYKKAGYTEYSPRNGWQPASFWTQSAKLMYKTFQPAQALAQGRSA